MVSVTDREPSASELAMVRRRGYQWDAGGGGGGRVSLTMEKFLELVEEATRIGYSGQVWIF